MSPGVRLAVALQRSQLTASYGRYQHGPNGRLLDALGWIFLVLITLGALAAIPLMVVTHMGEG